MCSGSEAGSYLRLIDFVNHSTLGLRVIKKKKNMQVYTSDDLMVSAGSLQGYLAHRKVPQVGLCGVSITLFLSLSVSISLSLSPSHKKLPQEGLCGVSAGVPHS